MTLDQLVNDATRNGRICPQPKIWNELWELLPDRRRAGVGWEPPLPLILAAWWHASDEEKRKRFHLHLKWASEHGCLEAVGQLLASMKPEDWYTGK